MTLSDSSRPPVLPKDAAPLVAAVVGMSPRNLARHFVQATGITPHEFMPASGGRNRNRFESTPPAFTVTRAKSSARMPRGRMWANRGLTAC
jgi:hypothetical protein